MQHRGGTPWVIGWGVQGLDTISTVQPGKTIVMAKNSFWQKLWKRVWPRKNRRRPRFEHSARTAEVALLEPRTLLTVTFHGGALISNVQTQGIYLGSDWQSTSTLQSQTGQIDQYLSTLVSGAYMDMLTNAGYNVGRGSSSTGAVRNVTLNKTTGVTDATIQQNIQSMITAGQVQAPNSNRLYVIYVEPGVVVHDGTDSSATSFLGYHGAFAGRTSTGAAADIRYAVMPYPGGVNPSPSSQGFASAFDELTVVSSHEVAEAVTDPDVNYKSLGWYDDNLNGEIGDLTDLTATLNGYLVQQVVNKNDQPIAPQVTTTSPTVSITAIDGSAAETLGGAAANGGSFQVSRTGATTSALTVTLSISGTATNGTDYNSISTTVTIPAGAASTVVNLVVKDDTLVEGTENAVFTLAGGTGYLVNSASSAATISIADNDVSTALPVVTLTAVDASAAETRTGETPNGGSFQVTRTGSTATPLTVNFTISGTATNGTDYNTIATSVTIPAGATSALVSLTVKDDSIAEPTETASFTLASDAGYTIGTTAAATISIADNDSSNNTSNNSFGSRTLLSGTSITATGSNVGATVEAGEPNVLGIGGTASVWWTWTAPTSGTVTLSTTGSSFDTTLGVYQGTTVSSLKQVAVNDDENYSAGVYTSKLTFSAVAGQSYQIAVNGYSSQAVTDTGSIKLALNQSLAAATVATLKHDAEWLFW